MITLSEQQEKVFQEAKVRLNKYKWFKGICLNMFPTDKEIDYSFELAVQRVVDETMYWDAWIERKETGETKWH